MKKCFWFFLYIFFFLSVFAQNRKIEFSIIPYTGLSCGSYDEILFSSMGKKKEVSVLEWKIDDLWYFGTDFNIKIERFSIQAGIEYAVPLICGNMYDSDFDSFSDLQHCYSISEMNSKTNLHTHLDLSYIINSCENFSIAPKISILYFYDFFEARNGYGWYGFETETHPLVAWDDPRAKFYKKGTLGGADFCRHSVMSFLGLNYSFKIQKLTINTEMLFSPFCWFNTTDIHLSKSRDYHLIQTQFSFLSQFLICCEVDYSISKTLMIYTHIQNIAGNLCKGLLYDDYSSKSPVLSDQKSGSSLNMYSISVGLGFSF